jgi:hypothetical protein
MDADLKAKWVEALRSGKYQQQRGELGSGTKLCCLGVFSTVATGGPTYMPWAHELGCDSRFVKYLIEMNDGERVDGEWEGGATFSDIADFIEENL